MSAPTPTLACMARVRLKLVHVLAMVAVTCHACMCSGAAASDYADALVVGAFNVQVFGQSKMSKPAVPEVLVHVIRTFDLLLVQEIRDKSMASPETLLGLVNTGLRDGAGYRLLVSGRYGSTSSKEAYGFFYRAGRLAPVSHHAGEGDFPERPPYVVSWLTHSGFTFTTVGMHVDPDNVVHELDQLGQVAAGLVGAGHGVVVMGDFNADCGYLGKTKWACIRSATCNDTSIALWDGKHFSSQHWLIGDDADTTVAASSCAYDRFVVSGALLNRVVPAASHVYRFDTVLALNATFTKLVSDHYPIVMRLNVSNVTSNGTRHFAEQPTTHAPAQEPTSLAPGALAVVAFHSDNINGTDYFAVAFLQDIAAGTELRVTDNGWDCVAKKFRPGEGVLVWRANKAYAAGVVAEYPGGSVGLWSKGGGRLALSTAADQLYVYQDKEGGAGPAFLFAISSVGKEWDRTATSTAAGCLPEALAASNMSFIANTGHTDNLLYTGPRSGTAKALRQSVVDASNWKLTNAPLDLASLVQTFTVVPAATTTPARTTAAGTTTKALAPTAPTTTAQAPGTTTNAAAATEAATTAAPAKTAALASASSNHTSSSTFLRCGSNQSSAEYQACYTKTKTLHEALQDVADTAPDTPDFLKWVLFLEDISFQCCVGFSLGNETYVYFSGKMSASGAKSGSKTTNYKSKVYALASKSTEALLHLCSKDLQDHGCHPG